MLNDTAVSLLAFPQVSVRPAYETMEYFWYLNIYNCLCWTQLGAYRMSYSHVAEVLLQLLSVGESSTR